MVCHPKLTHAVTHQSETGDIMTVSLHIFRSCLTSYVCPTNKDGDKQQVTVIIQGEWVGEGDTRWESIINHSP